MIDNQNTHRVNFDSPYALKISSSTTNVSSYAGMDNVVGGYRFGKQKNPSTQINLHYKPNWFHRTMMRLCLGMYWTDI